MTFRRNPEFMQRLRQAAAERTNAATEQIRLQIVRTMERDTGTGEMRPGQIRRASAPGEPLVSQTGRTARSMQAYPAIDKGSYIVGAAGTEQWKIWFNERGTATMAPRPTLLPSLIESKAAVMQAMGGGR